jgi:hypothetical protein
VLLLIIAHGHVRRLVEENICSHEDGVGQQANPVSALSLSLFFELRHSLEFTVRGDAFEEPVELRVPWHLTLYEKGASVLVYTACEKRSKQLPGVGI